MIEGCTDSSANNFNSDANSDDGSCDYDQDDDGVLDSDEVAGCTDESANNTIQRLQMMMETANTIKIQTILAKYRPTL